MNESSVSPLRWLTITPQPAPRANRHLLIEMIYLSIDRSIERRKSYAAMASVIEPIWLTLSRRQSHAFFSIADWIRVTLVTVKSSLNNFSFVRQQSIDFLCSFLSLTQLIEHHDLWQRTEVLGNHSNHLDRSHLQWKWWDIVQFVSNNRKPIVHWLAKKAQREKFFVKNQVCSFEFIYIIWFAFFFVI